MALKAQLFEAFASRPRPTAAGLLRDGAVHSEKAAPLRDLLAQSPASQLWSPHDIRTIVAGNLWMLTPEAFCYFLPGFLSLCLESHTSVNALSSELIEALTVPEREDVVEAFDRLAEIPTGLGLPADVVQTLREQGLKAFDSGKSTAAFQDRFEHLAPSEGAAVLAFLVAFQEAHGVDFPFDEVETAIERHWARYRQP